MDGFPTCLVSATENYVSASAPAPADAAVGVEINQGLILATLLCALFSVVGMLVASHCALRHCLRVFGYATNASSSSSSAPPPSPPCNKGLEKKVLQSLPKINYTTTTNIDPDNLEQSASSSSSSSSSYTSPTECPICLAEYVEGDEMRVLPQCGHRFHVVCIDKWLSSNSSCPSCRQVLEVGCDNLSGEEAVTIYSDALDSFLP